MEAPLLSGAFFKMCFLHNCGAQSKIRTQLRQVEIDSCRRKKVTWYSLLNNKGVSL